MLQKRRLTVHPVDSARLCGSDSGTVVSFLNGIDHLIVDPAATDQDEAAPLPSRVTAHTYTGAQLADAAVDTQRECVVEAAVNAAAVVACRMAPLSASQANPSALYPVRAEGPSKVVFFAGCQRLAEVRLGDDGAADKAGTVDAAACPMQCFRAELGGPAGSIPLDIAAFMTSPQTLCACTPQLGAVLSIQFDEEEVNCMGPGRVGEAEVTVVLSSNVAVLCSLLSAPSSSSTDSACKAAMAHNEQEQLNDSRAAAEAAREAFAQATAQCQPRILHTVQLPSPPGSPAPMRVAWSGARTLWVVYSDGSVTAVQCGEAATAHAADAVAQNEESQPPADEAVAPSALRVTGLACSRLTQADGAALAMAQVHVTADPRAPVLHVAVATHAADCSSSSSSSSSGGAKAGPPTLCYGTVRWSEKAAASVVQWRLQQMVYDEQLYGVRFERGLHRILTQAARGQGPLFVATLPRDAPVHTSPATEADAETRRSCLAAAIMCSPESELGHYCQACESLLRDLQAAAQQLAHPEDADALQHQLMQAQHAIYALLRRQRQSLGGADLAPSESLPHRLLQRAMRLHRQISAYVLFLRLGVMSTVSQPLRSVLRLDAAAAMSKAAQGQWTALMRDTFKTASVYQSPVSNLAMWQSPAPLCIEVLLEQLGLSPADLACTMTAVLSRMDALTVPYALLILYYSYLGMGCAGDATTAAVTVPSLQEQQQQRQWRESFLGLFGHPVELNVWAFASYAVDHGVNPSETRDGAADAPVYVLGPAVRHLGVPPFPKLLAPVLTGLSHAAALDVLLQLIPSCLAAYNTGDGEGMMPVAVAMRLLTVAVRAGSHAMIGVLYESMRATPLLHDLAAQPLAFAALAARDVSAMRGWVEVGSPVAATVERTLLACEDAQQRDATLVSFYILMQRYEDALRVSSTAATRDATQAQRLQVVRSYLRSLLTASSEAWGEAEAEAAAAAQTAAAPGAASPRHLAKDAGLQHAWRATTLGAPLLETSPAAQMEQLRRVAAEADRRAVAQSGGGAAGRALALQQHHHHHHHHAGDHRSGSTSSRGGSAQPVVRPPLFRPSTLLQSVDRSAGSRGASSPAPSSTFH